MPWRGRGWRLRAAARADLLTRAGAREEASDAYERAINLERDDAVRRFLQRRKAALSSGGS